MLLMTSVATTAIENKQPIRVYKIEGIFLSFKNILTNFGNEIKKQETKINPEIILT